jgi:hypothetical protein
LIDREGTGRRDKSTDTTRATVTSTRNSCTINMKLRPVGRETRRRAKPGFCNNKESERGSILQYIGDDSGPKTIGIP